jgi:hypothetical protein
MSRAESWLRERGIPADRWSGMKIRHAENTPGGPWSSVIIDIERRGAEWIVTQIDRRFVSLPANDVGLSIV